MKKFAGKSKWRAKCFLVRSDLLVFEDLNLLGYKHLEHRTDFQIAHIECALNSISKMHASGIAYETREATIIGSKFENVLFETSIGLTNIWYLVGLEVRSDCSKYDFIFIVHESMSHICRL